MICRIAQWFDDCISSPYAPFVYAACAIVMQLTLVTDVNTLVLSHFANVALIFLSISGKRHSTRLMKQVDELTRVNPDIDEQAVIRETQL